MRYLPINLDVRNRFVVCIGGGAVAQRKCRTLLEAGARVRVVAPRLTAQLAELAAEGRIEHAARPYADGDLEGAFLAFAATDDPAVNRAVAEEARSRGTLADIVSDPGLGTFTSPSLVCRGELLLTVSTGGTSPALSRKIRQDLEKQYGPEYGRALELLAAVREKLLTEKENDAYNKRILKDLVERHLPYILGAAPSVPIDDLLLYLSGPEMDPAEREADAKDPS